METQNNKSNKKKQFIEELLKSYQNKVRQELEKQYGEKFKLASKQDKQTIQSLHEGIHTLHSENLGLVDTVKNMCTQNADQAEEIKSLKDECDVATEKLSSHESLNCNLKNQASLFEQKNNSLEEDAKKYQSEFERASFEYNKKIHSLTEETLKLKQQISALTAECDKLNSLVSEKECTISKQQTQIGELVERELELQKRFANLVQQKEADTFEYNEKIKKLQSDKNQQTINLSSKQGDLSRLERAIENKDNLIGQLRDSLRLEQKKLQSDKQEFVMPSVESQKEIAALQESMKIEKNQKAELSKIVEQHRLDNKKLSAKVVEVEKDYDILRKEIRFMRIARTEETQMLMQVLKRNRH